MVRIRLVTVAALAWVGLAALPVSAQGRQDPADASQHDTVVLHVEGMT